MPRTYVVIIDYIPTANDFILGTYVYPYKITKTKAEKNKGRAFGDIYSKLIMCARRNMRHDTPDDVVKWCSINGCNVESIIIDDIEQGLIIIPQDDVAEVALRLRWL